MAQIVQTKVFLGSTSDPSTLEGEINNFLVAPDAQHFLGNVSQSTLKMDTNLLAIVIIATWDDVI